MLFYSISTCPYLHTYVPCCKSGTRNRSPVFFLRLFFSFSISMFLKCPFTPTTTTTTTTQYCTITKTINEWHFKTNNKKRRRRRKRIQRNQQHSRSLKWMFIGRQPVYEGVIPSWMIGRPLPIIFSSSQSYGTITHSYC